MNITPKFLEEIKKFTLEIFRHMTYDEMINTLVMACSFNPELGRIVLKMGEYSRSGSNDISFFTLKDLVFIKGVGLLEIIKMIQEKSPTEKTYTFPVHITMQ